MITSRFNPSKAVLGRLNLNPGAQVARPSARSQVELPKRITKHQRAQAVELYQSGLSLNATAKAVGISRTTVRSALDHAGVHLRS